MNTKGGSWHRAGRAQQATYVSGMARQASYIRARNNAKAWHGSGLTRMISVEVEATM